MSPSYEKTCNYSCSWILGGAAHWAKVIIELSRQGYSDLHAVELPLTSLADDVTRLNKMIAQQKGEVLLVGHSYGGAVISEAGNLPNVTGLVYVAAFAPDSGESAGSLSHALPPEAIASIVSDSDGYLWVRSGEYHRSFCADLAAEDALVMEITQKAPLGTAFSDIISVPAWRLKPSWYQISGRDHMIHPENQKMMAERVDAKKIVTLDTSHASLVSRPADIAKLIVEAAKSVVMI